MKCEKCGSGSATLDTRVFDGYSRRKRKCKNCGFIFRTREVLEVKKKPKVVIKKVIKEVKKEEPKKYKEECSDEDYYENYDYLNDGSLDKW